MAITSENNKRIAKNTLFLYVRMMLTMLVTLYTSRVVLKVLGVDDYGLYNVVGGVVGMLSFLNGTLSIGTARFLTYEIGRSDETKLKKTFSTSLSIHILLGIFIIIIAETLGLWFVYNKLTIPPSRLSAAVFAYQFSILTTVVAITQVPYNAAIIAHERMSIYAYFSIIEVFLKLGIVYLLQLASYDKLASYALLMFVVQFCIALFYRIYSLRHFKETAYSFILDKTIFKNILSFSGWNLLANLSMSLNNQGTLVITNMFFGPAVVAAQSIANQVNQAVMTFVGNFRTAVNPQIIKTYAAQDFGASKKLTLQTTCYVFYLLLLVGLPLILLAPQILNFWLTTVPEYTVVFVQLIIIQNLVDSFGASFYIPLMASSKIRGNSFFAIIIGIVRFAIVYVLFVAGFSPTTVLWVGIGTYSLYSFVIKPYLLIENVDYHWKDFIPVFLLCLKVTILSVTLPLLLSYFIEGRTLTDFLIILFSSLFWVCLIVYSVGITSSLRSKILFYIKQKI